MCVSAYTCRCQHMCIHARIHTSMHTNGNPHVGPQVYKLEMYSETGLAKSKKSSEHKMNHKSHTHTYTTVNPMVRSSRFMTVDINYVRAEKLYMYRHTYVNIRVKCIYIYNIYSQLLIRTILYFFMCLYFVYNLRILMLGHQTLQTLDTYGPGAKLQNNTNAEHCTVLL